MIVVRSLSEALDGQVEARGLAARELSVVQVRLVHDLGDDLGATIGAVRAAMTATSVTV